MKQGRLTAPLGAAGSSDKTKTMTNAERIYESFREFPKTIGQVSRETGFSKGEVRRHVRDMYRDGKIWRLCRVFRLPKFGAYLWTTNKNTAWGHLVFRALSGKSYSADEQIAIVKTVKPNLK